MDCPTFPEITINEWNKELVAPIQGRRYPLSGAFELTERCNLACVHCYINQPASSGEAATREVTTAQAMGILDQVADAGCLFLLLTGGEPLLRPDFAEIYRHARQRGIIVTLFTNGTLLTPRIADVLAEWPVSLVEISLYGASADTYERVTQVPGSYARCRRGIELLLERELPLTLKSMLLTANHHELGAMRDLAEQLGVRYRYSGMLWPRVDGGRQPFEYRLSLEEMIALDREDPERQRAWEETAESCRGRPVRSEYVYSCGAAFRAFQIDAAGRLCVCAMVRRPAYDLLQMSFDDGWEALGVVRGQKRQMDTPCRTCTVGALCNQCPGWSQTIHGDNETPVRYICELGHLRAALVQSAHS